jgi:hypothetical protein
MSHSTDELLAWAAIMFGDTPDVVGAQRRSDRLHWTREAAQREVQGWVGAEPIQWDKIEERTMIGRVGRRVMVVTSVYLPKGCRIEI